MQADNNTNNRLSMLLVDDEEGFVTVLSKRLSRRNIDVTGLTAGDEAVRTLRARNFDVAVLDVKMEDMDGIELLRIFRIMVPDIPVIMLTGHGSEQAAREGLACGAFDYLTKPCDLDELVHKIRSAVAQGR